MHTALEHLGNPPNDPAESREAVTYEQLRFQALKPAVREPLFDRIK